MASLDEHWKLPAAVQPKPHDYAYDLDRALSSVIGLSAQVPADAYTAEILGTQRAGNGVLIRDDGLVLTIGYLITEAEEVWLRTNAGRVVQGHVLAYDQVTGFGLIQAVARLDLPVLPIGDSTRAPVGEQVVVAGMGGRARSVAARIVARQEFAGYWEYLLDEAIFTAPGHPDWGGTALIGSKGELLGIGSLQLQGATSGGGTLPLNMIVPIDLLTPILEDVTRFGRPKRPPRPWLGLYASETENKVVIVGLATRGPAEQAGVEAGDIVLAVAGRAVGTLASFFRRVWALGEAGVEVPVTIHRAGRMFELRITSADRNGFLKVPRLH
jgi:S1-C subfamily serine protease